MAADLGVDAVFVEAPESVAELERIAAALPGVTLVANMVETGRTPLLTPAELGELGFALIVSPLSGLFAAVRALGERLRAPGRGTARMRDDLASLVELRRLHRPGGPARGRSPGRPLPRLSPRVSAPISRAERGESGERTPGARGSRLTDGGPADFPYLRHQEWPGQPGPATWDGHPRCHPAAALGRRWGCGPRPRPVDGNEVSGLHARHQARCPPRCADRSPRSEETTMDGPTERAPLSADPLPASGAWRPGDPVAGSTVRHHRRRPPVRPRGRWRAARHHPGLSRPGARSTPTPATRCWCATPSPATPTPPGPAGRASRPRAGGTGSSARVGASTPIATSWCA